MKTKFDYANDVGKQNARMMANRHQNLTIEEKQAMNTYLTHSICIVKMM